MKTTRRIFSMVLALMMVLSLSVTVFADTTTGKATVVIKNGDETVATLSPDAGQSVYEALQSNADLTCDWSSFTDYYGNPAKALTGLTYSEKGVVKAELESGAADGASSGVTAQWSTKRPGYGFEGFAYDDNDEIAGYNYVYVGNDFVYTVKNGSTSVDVSDKYMNQYTMQAGDVVTIYYKLVVSRWTATTPFETTEPYI